MKERPILFSGAMVRAILQGRKTQERRVVRPQPDCTRTSLASCAGNRSVRVIAMREGMFSIFCTFGQPGDRLWVKENHWRYKENVSVKMLRDGADTWPMVKGEYLEYDDDGQLEGLGWKKYSPIFMPRWASRITLEITAVRVERLQDITEVDAVAEGIYFDQDFDGYVSDDEGRHYHGNSAVRSYEHLWQSINGFGSWEANPFVWVLEFRRVQP
jgi:hypothetical protein